MTPEERFMADVEASFPSDPEAAVALIKRACALSSNAAFTIPFELAVRARVASDEALLLLDIWAALFDHPLKALVLRFARAILQKETLPVQITHDGMDLVAKHAGEYQALNVVYFSQREVPELDALYDEIHEAWES